MMVPTGWHRLLFYFLWIAPQILNGVLAVILCKRRLYREFPCFLACLLFGIADFIVLFPLHLLAKYSVAGVTWNHYGYAYYATILFGMALRFGMIDEVSRDLFRDSQFLKVPARRLLLGATGLLLGIGILFAIYAPGENSIWWAAGAATIYRGAAVVQSGLLLAVFLLSRFLGLTWRRPAFGIALGLGIISTVDLATSAIRAELTNLVVAVRCCNLLTMSTYLVCVSLWIKYLRAPELSPASLTVIPHEDVEIWNKELQEFLRQ